MKKPKIHILVCNSYRIAGEAQGTCAKKGGAQFIQYITEGANDRGLDVAVSSTGCLNVCAQGPIMVVHPNNYWFGAITEESIDEILDALENNEPAQKYMIAD
jgi:(2Fe-2S) ferredoxin